jgi:hypothetical protein
MMLGSNNRKKIFEVMIILILIAGGLILASLISKYNNQQKWIAFNDFYSEDDCNCLERRLPGCSLKGFEYNETRKLCVNSGEKTVTYSILNCSKYKCSGKIYEFNFQAKNWEENK